MNAQTFGPIPGSTIFNGISGKKAIIMAANTRIATVAEGTCPVRIRSQRGIHRDDATGILGKDECSGKGDRL